jgi:hypothetical protein
VHRQGAGMLQIATAIAATTKIEPGKLALGESEAGPATRRLWIENNASVPVTYTSSPCRERTFPTSHWESWTSPWFEILRP